MNNCEDKAKFLRSGDRVESCRISEGFAELLGIVSRLRKECPWDRKQSMETLRTLTVEEVFELGDAVLKSDAEGIKKELGDLMMHTVFYALLGEEKGWFDMGDVLESICEKLKYRHPHIYGDVHVDNEKDVLRNWEALKLKEKGGNGGVLTGVPHSLPALIKAFRIQVKAGGAGFDWEKKEEVWTKVKEELGEFETEMKNDDACKMEEEFGDLMFAMVNAARLYGINPEDALEKANRKFIRRFSEVEERVKRSGEEIGHIGIERLDAYWNETKSSEKLEKK